MGRTSVKGLHNLLEEYKKLGEGTTSPSDQLPLEVVFLNSLNNTIKQTNTRPNKTTQTYKPSSLQCERAMYYQVGGAALGEVINTPEAGLVGIGESGSARHEHIQAYIMKMKDAGYNWEYVDVATFVKERGLTNLEVKPTKSEFETKLHNHELNMNFMTDGILKYNDEYLIFEYKTETSFKWAKRTEVDEKHHDQAISYCTSFGLDKVIFVYENRDTCDKKAYLFKVTPEMKLALKEKIKRVDGYLERKELPPKTENKRLCYYCQYKDICKVDRNIE